MAGALMRSRLTLSWALAIFAASLVPLGGAWLASERILARAIDERVRAAQADLAQAGATVVLERLEKGRSKLAAIARLLEKESDPERAARTLDATLDPPDLFLELAWWSAERPSLVTQSQTPVFQDAQLLNAARDFDAGRGQKVLALHRGDPLYDEPLAGRAYTSTRIERAAAIESLPLSAPIPGRGALIASLDLRPLRELFARFAGDGERALALRQGGELVLASRELTTRADDITSERVVGHGDFTVVVREPAASALLPLAQARAQVLGWFAGSCLLAAALALFFARRVTRPVRELALVAQRLGRGELATRSGITRADEIGDLARSFDRMAEALQELDRVKSEFVAHVSHELRTPLASAKIALANVQEGLAGPEALQRVRADLDRLIGMVNELLDVARIEAGIRLAREPVRLDEIVRAAVESLQPLARVPVHVTGAGDTLALDRARVHQIVVNLVDNALKHARGRVEVVVEAASVRVSDDGPGVPAELRERVFERFSSFESAASGRGVGLGLSIARKLALLHGGTLVCEGNSFLLRF